MKPSATIFLDAIKNGEVTKFLAGEPPYFIDAKNDNEEPQNVNDAFKLVIFAAWQESYDPKVPDAFSAGLTELLCSHQDSNKAIYLACGWLWFYAYCLKDKKENVGSVYKDLFEIDLELLALTLRNALEANESPLRSDKRWAGAEWNSQEGLWAPLVRLAITIRDQLGGGQTLFLGPATDEGSSLQYV